MIRKPNAASVKDLAVLASQDDDPIIRRIAAIGLGKLRVPEAKAALMEALFDEDSLVRKRAIHGLGKTWGKSVIEPLSIALVEDAEPSVVLNNRPEWVPMIGPSAERWALNDRIVASSSLPTSAL